MDAELNSRNSADPKSVDLAPALESSPSVPTLPVRESDHLPGEVREALLAGSGDLQTERPFRSAWEAIRFFQAIVTLILAVVGEGVYSACQLVLFLLQGGRRPRVISHGMILKSSKAS